MSADGSMVAGGDNWWKTSGQTGIFGPFPGQQDQTQAFGLSPDGQVAVGGAIKGSDPFGPTFHAFRWTAKTGMQDLRTAVQSAGVKTANGWVVLTTADGVSADGTVIVGYGLNPRTKAFPFGQWEPFRIVLPVP